MKKTSIALSVIAIGLAVALAGCTSTQASAAKATAVPTTPTVTAPQTVTSGSSTVSGAATVAAPVKKKKAKKVVAISGSATISGAATAINPAILATSTLPTNTLFALNLYTVTPEFNAYVVSFAKQYVQVASTQTVYVTGFTDSTGPLAFNMTLSQNRAQAVANILIANGIPSNNIVVSYQGPSYPVADNSTDAGRQQNRRTVVAFTQFQPTSN
ncbi:MAG: OmpA family protein [Fusobacteria bacterium]|nr:OmpA family protein [Fusobacteriota bacterium]